MTTSSKHPETIGLHGGDYRSDATTTSVAVPIYQTTSYQFNNTDHAANLFALKEFGNIYTRIMNPTVDVLEKRVAALEGGVAALAVGSGQAASAFCIQNLCKAGDNIVASTDLYGGTVNLFKNTLKDQGIEVRFADPIDPKNFEKLTDDKSRHSNKTQHLCALQRDKFWCVAKCVSKWVVFYYTLKTQRFFNISGKILCAKERLPTSAPCDSVRVNLGCINGIRNV